MGSSAHNSSGVRWCRRRVRFNKVPEVPGGFGAEPGQVQQGSVEHSGEGSNNPWCKAKSSSTGSVGGSGEGLGGFGAESGQVQQGFGEGSGDGLGSFGAESGQVQQGSGEGSSEGSRERSGSLWRRVPEKAPEKVPCKAKSGSTANFSGTESASEYNLKCTTRFVQCHLHSYTTDVYMYMNPNAEVSFTPPWNQNILGFDYGSSSAGPLCDLQLSIFGAFPRVKTVLLQTTGTGAT